MKRKRNFYFTAGYLRQLRNEEEYKEQYEKLKKGEIKIPNWESLNEIDLARLLHTEYAKDLERRRNTKYGSLLGKG